MPNSVFFSEVYALLRRRVSAARAGIGFPKLSASQVAEKILGRDATTVIDVGARWGAQDAWWRLHPIAKLVGFEPDAKECGRLNQRVPKHRSEVFVPKALGEKVGTGVLHVAKHPACSSLYPPSLEVAERYPQCAEIKEASCFEVELTTLNQWWSENQKPRVGFIKLDTQGSELDILRGGSDVLETCLGLELEVEFNPLYEGQPLFFEVDGFLRKRGFSLWQLKSLCYYSENPMGRTHPSDSVHFDGRWRKTPAGSGRLFWGNAIYFRDYRSVPLWEDQVLLAAWLERCGDRDGSAACLKWLKKEKEVSTSWAILIEQTVRQLEVTY